MLRRCVLFAVLLSLSTAASAVEPLLLLLLRMLRDQAISASVERGVGAVREESVVTSPPFGYALPLPAVEPGTEEQRLRAVIDESFLHLSAAQRDSVFAGVQKIMRDPQYASLKPRIVAEFTLKAQAVRDGYRVLDKLSYAEKRSLAAQAKEEFMRLPVEERRHLIEVLQSGMLPVPRDLSAIMLAELSTVHAAP